MQANRIALVGGVLGDKRIIGSSRSSLVHLDIKALLELLLALISHNSGACTLLLHYPATFDQLRPHGCTQRSSQVWTTLGPIGTSEGETAAKASHRSQI